MKTWIKFLMGAIGLIVIAITVACINVATGSSILVAALVLPGFTEEQSKSFEDFLTKQSTDIQTKVKGLIDNLKDTDLIKGIQALITGEGDKKGIVGDLKAMQDQFDTYITDQKKKEKEGGLIKDDLSIYDAMKQLIASDEFKAAKATKFAGNKVFSLKALTTDITGTVNRTVQKLSIAFAPERALAFLPYLNVGYIGQDKSRVLWVEGAYTSNVGYVAEGTGPATPDTGTATEKTRGMAKISAKLPLSAELLEDADYIASAFKMKMQEKSMLFTDLEAYSGNGSDGPNPTHVYGIQGHATAFSAATAGVTNSVPYANIGDLMDACILQAAKSEHRGMNVVWLNPSDFFALKKAKDQNGQYLFVKDINGSYTINGLQVIVSNAVTANTMLVADTAKIQLWWKRNPEVKFSQMNGTDFIDDMYTAVMFLRAQIVVETQDKTALVYVADITAELATITSV
jgi:HK97 family phage major capsid protein